MDTNQISRGINAFLILGIVSTGLCMPTNSDWFQAQSRCAEVNQMLTTDRTLSGSSYWTARYQRISHWIKLNGCFDETDVYQHAAVRATLENSSAGYCQEICMKSNISIFAIKKSTCLCLRELVTESQKNASKCNLTCPNNIDDKFTKECGGETAFNVFNSKKAFNCSTYLDQPGDCAAIECNNAASSYFCSNCTLGFSGLCQPGDSSNLIKNITYLDWENSMERCTEDHFGYLVGNLPLSNASKACNQINKTKGGQIWIGAARQRYQGIDRGYSIDTGEKDNFIKCEKCEKKRGKNLICSFVNCTESHRVNVDCTDINFSTVTYPITSTTTGRVSSTETTKATTEVRETTTSTQLLTITVIGTAGTINPLKNSTLNPSEKKTTRQEISTIIVPVVLILFGAILGGIGLIWWRRKKAKGIKGSVAGKPEIHFNVNQEESPRVHHEENDVPNSSYFILEPKSSYEELGNEIPQAENPYIETKEGEYDHLRNSKDRRKVTDIDETTKTENLKKETEEGNYDHLGNAPSRSNIIDDTYCHTSPNQLDSSSDYDMAYHTEHKDTENTYDHTGGVMHLQNNSNYDYSELKR